MRDGWRDVKLKDVCQEITVGHVGPMADQYVSDGIPFLRSQNIGPFRINTREVKFITKEFHRKLKKSALGPGDVVVVRTGYPGTASVIPERMLVANCADVVIIRPSTEIDSWFLTCLFNSTWGRGTVAGKLVGVAQQHFNIGAAKEMVVHLPPISTQRNIAAILSAYDDLIDNNARRIKILEDIARSLYCEWFVNPCKAGRLPEGWAMKCVNDFVSIKSGFAFKSGTFTPDGSYGLITIKNVHDGAFIDECQSRISDLPPRMPEYCHVKTGDILLSLTGNIGRVCLAHCQNYLLNQRVAKLVPRVPQNRAFTYFTFRQSGFQSRLKMMANGVAQQNLSPIETGRMEHALPQSSLLAKFSELSEPLIDQMLSLSLKNANLCRTRDLLLPKLISGEIPIGNDQP